MRERVSDTCDEVIICVLKHFIVRVREFWATYVNTTDQSKMDYFLFFTKLSCFLRDNFNMYLYQDNLKTVENTVCIGKSPTVTILVTTNNSQKLFYSTLFLYHLSYTTPTTKRNAFVQVIHKTRTAILII